MSQYAFITGATSGIGLATAKALAEKKYDLVLAARNTEKLQQVKETIASTYGVQVTTYTLDVQKKDDIHRVVDSCLAQFGAPDVLVNDAGLARGLEPYGETKEEDILQMIDTNIKGLFLMTRAFLPAMLKRNTGHIVNMGSTAGLYAYAGAAVYCATKAAVKTFSDGVRIDVIDSDIKVTTIQPGIVETPFSEVRFHGDKERAAKVYEGIDALQAEDIADIIAFAVSRPKRVQISDIVIMANQQATGFMVSKKKKC
ncbi:MAG TPA: NAD(P)-dependent oxidoreductase [Dialister sp.]|nr:NAD(P)-dependent oxidoreductase [Dialister sp.]